MVAGATPAALTPRGQAGTSRAVTQKNKEVQIQWSARVTDPEHVEAAPDKPSSSRRTIHIVGAVVVVVVLPVVLLDALVGKFVANALLLGLLFGVLGSMVAGTRRMVYLAVPFGVAGGLGAFTAYGWWWVGLLALLGAIAGAGIGFGWLLSFLMLPFAATFAGRVSSGRDALAYGVFAGIGLLYGVVLARRFKAPEAVEGQRVSAPTAAVVPFGTAASGWPHLRRGSSRERRWRPHGEGEDPPHQNTVTHRWAKTQYGSWTRKPQDARLPPFLRQRPDCPRRRCRDRTKGPGPCESDDNPQHVQPSLADC